MSVVLSGVISAATASARSSASARRRAASTPCRSAHRSATLSAGSAADHGLLTGDVTLHPRGLLVDVLTGKTKHSVRTAKFPYADDPEICPVPAYGAYRTRLVAEQGQQWAALSTAGVRRHRPLGPHHRRHGPWLRHPRSQAHLDPGWSSDRLDRPLPAQPLASIARRAGRDGIAIADQGGWARHSRSMLGYMQRGDGRDDNAACGLTWSLSAQPQQVRPS